MKYGKLGQNCRSPKREATHTRSYPDAILYDFETYGDKDQRKELTGMLTIENAHIPISVNIGDTLDRKPTHICEKDPVELVCKFMEELERCGENIRTKVRAVFMPDDARMLPKHSASKSKNGAIGCQFSGIETAALFTLLKPSTRC